MPEPDDNYEVGFGKPPRSTQFQKGKSGNPAGRPKGSKNLANIVLRESRQFVRINGPNGTRKVTKLEAAVMQMCNKSAQGNHRAQSQHFGLVRQSEESISSAAAPIKMRELDQKVIEGLRRRMAQTPTSESTAPKEQPNERP